MPYTFFSFFFFQQKIQVAKLLRKNLPRMEKHSYDQSLAEQILRYTLVWQVIKKPKITLA